MPGQNPHGAGSAVSGGHDDSGTMSSATQGERRSWRARAGLLLVGSTLGSPLFCAVARAQGTGVATAGH